ncbi:MAG: hypothetical protein E5Y19_30150 [Mesorhizobium sp.]|nr:MAG: hypothetical protein E5Y19_30150 [Mesorhizobium sp.]
MAFVVWGRFINLARRTNRHVHIEEALKLAATRTCEEIASLLSVISRERTPGGLGEEPVINPRCRQARRESNTICQLEVCFLPSPRYQNRQSLQGVSRLGTSS